MDGHLVRTTFLKYPGGSYLIRTNFRADKFSHIFAQNLYLRKMTRKLVPNLGSFVAGAQEFNRVKIFELGIEKKLCKKTVFS